MELLFVAALAIARCARGLPRCRTPIGVDGLHPQLAPRRPPTTPPATRKTDDTAATRHPLPPCTALCCQPSSISCRPPPPPPKRHSTCPVVTERKAAPEPPTSPTPVPRTRPRTTLSAFPMSASLDLPRRMERATMRRCDEARLGVAPMALAGRRARGGEARGKYIFVCVDSDARLVLWWLLNYTES